MIERYTRPEMGEIFSERARYQRWLDVEIAFLEVLAEDGKVPRDDLAIIKERASFDVARVAELEATVQHDVIAFLTAVAEKVGPASRHIHFGLTSSDILDTATALQIKDAASRVLSGVDAVREALAEQALRHKMTPCVGRTHGIHAEPMTFGLKMALFYEELGRARARLVSAAAEMAVGKLSGAVGTFAHLSPDIEERTLRRLGLSPDPIATQVVQRDRHAAWICALGLLGATYEKVATEIRNLQRTDIREVEEPFGRGQKGSSAMPHKRNPIASENVAGLARLLRSYVVPALENVTLWHERDITHSSVERVILPDSAILADYMSYRLARIVKGLSVYPEAMKKNLDKMRGLVFSGQLLLALAEKGITREEAYLLVQENAMRVWDGDASFPDLVKRDPKIARLLSPAELEEVFSLDAQLRHVDAIFARVFGPGGTGGGQAPALRT
ncbi:MAG: adenylosuccinate lyase [Acidobacteriota bacterium]